jgi:hypothetical protein
MIGPTSWGPNLQCVPIWGSLHNEIKIGKIGGKAGGAAKKENSLLPGSLNFSYSHRQSLVLLGRKALAVRQLFPQRAGPLGPGHQLSLWKKRFASGLNLGFGWLILPELWAYVIWNQLICLSRSGCKETEDPLEIMGFLKVVCQEAWVPLPPRQCSLIPSPSPLPCFSSLHNL